MFLCSYRTFAFCMCFTVQFSKNCVLSSFVTTNDILSFRIASVNSFLILFSEEFKMFLLFPPAAKTAPSVPFGERMLSYQRFPGASTEN